MAVEFHPTAVASVRRGGHEPAAAPREGSMGLAPMTDAATWAQVPFHFWSVVFFCFGAMVGSFLNVCIHRLPRGESIVSPPSHCPHCGYHIPWYLNIPLVTWLWLRARCRHCGAPISARYFWVELLTALCFLGCWLTFGQRSAALALVYCLVLAGLIVATFIDYEHFIIPDKITLGGIGAGVLCSFLVPALHGETSVAWALGDSFLGAAVGGGTVYLILRAGKLLFGRQQVRLTGESRVVFGETGLVLPDKVIPYEELFYRDSDAIVFEGRRIEMVDRCYPAARIRLTPRELQIGDDRFAPETVAWLEAHTQQITLPREAMGLGDVKFMAAIGAFLGWHAVVFALMVSSMIGAAAGLALIALRRRAWSSRLPYGPYIALAAAIWIFGGHRLFYVLLDPSAP